jgi:hypothetical protein
MFATLYLPNFYLQAATRHQPELRAKPAALIDETEAKAAIIQLNEAAERAGVRKGMTPSQGLARCLGLLVKTRKYSQERLIEEILLQYAFTLAPYVEATAPGVCTIQFTKWHRHLSEPWALRAGVPADDSCARRSESVSLVRQLDESVPWRIGRTRPAADPQRTGSAYHKLLRLIEQLAECEITAQAGIAHLPDTSFLAAHLARPVLQIDDTKEFLAPLPIETLAIALT